MTDGGVLGLVFDLPEEPWTAEIRRLRAAYDVARSNFPVEITVAGSSGLGWFSPSQTLEHVAGLVRLVARTQFPFQCIFAGVEKFPQSQIFYLDPQDGNPFNAFQRALAASELQFEPTQYSYTPHCTIVQLPRHAPASVHVEIAAFPVPLNSVNISTVSIYSVNFATNACNFVLRFPLGA